MRPVALLLLIASCGNSGEPTPASSEAVDAAAVHVSMFGADDAGTCTCEVDTSKGFEWKKCFGCQTSSQCGCCLYGLYCDDP